MSERNRDAVDDNLPSGQKYTAYAGTVNVQWEPNSQDYVCLVYGPGMPAPVTLDWNNRNLAPPYIAQADGTPFGTRVQTPDGTTIYTPSYDPTATTLGNVTTAIYGYNINGSDQTVVITNTAGLKILTGLTIHFFTGAENKRSYYGYRSEADEIGRNTNRDLWTRDLCYGRPTSSRY
jgi:hypothetical protein